MESRRALVVGADGTLGYPLRKRLAAADWEVFGTTRRASSGMPGSIRLDLEQGAESITLPEEIATAWLLAAETSQAKCRADPARSRQINVEQTVALAKRLAGAGAFVVFPSSGAVFDGSVARTPLDCPLSPRGEYGVEKADAERAIRSLGAQATIVRLSKVIHHGMPLIRGWIDELRAQRRVTAFSDLIISPVPLEFAVDALFRIGERRAPGIFHVSGVSELSYFDLARLIALAVDASPELVRPVRAAQSGVAIEHLPEHATLDSCRLERELGLRAPTVDATVRSLLQHG